MANKLRTNIIEEQDAILDYIRNDETGFAVDINTEQGMFAFTDKLQIIADRVFHELLDQNTNTLFLVCMFDDGSAYVALDADEAALV